MAEVKMPSNSHKSRELSKTGEKKPVAKGNSTIRVASTGEQVKDSFISTTGSELKSYLIFDVLIPAAKELLSNVVTNGLSLLLYGDSKKPTNTVKRYGTSSYVDYSGYGNGRATTRVMQTRQRPRSIVEAVEFDTREEADDVLEALIATIMDDGMVVTCADLCQLTNLEYEYTANGFGWDDLSQAHIDFRRGKWVLTMPRAKRL